MNQPKRKELRVALLLGPSRRRTENDFVILNNPSLEATAWQDLREFGCANCAETFRESEVETGMRCPSCETGIVEPDPVFTIELDGDDGPGATTLLVQQHEASELFAAFDASLREHLQIGLVALDGCVPAIADALARRART